jgi:hypothetical protein
VGAICAERLCGAWQLVTYNPLTLLSNSARLIAGTRGLSKGFQQLAKRATVNKVLKIVTEIMLDRLRKKCIINQ